jgi:hypothetical protein
VLVIRAVSVEDLRMSVLLTAFILIPDEQEAGKNINKLVQEVRTERKVEFLCIMGMMSINVVSASECLGIHVDPLTPNDL